MASILPQVGPHNQSFQILRLRDGQFHRMISGLSQPLHDLRISAAIRRRISDNLLKQIHLHQPGTGKGEEQAARTRQLEGEQIDVFITPVRPLQIDLQFSKLGRIKDNQVKGSAFLRLLPQQLKHINKKNGEKWIVLASQRRKHGRVGLGNAAEKEWKLALKYSYIFFRQVLTAVKGKLYFF